MSRPRLARDQWNVRAPQLTATDSKQCCSTQSRQQQRFRHWLSLTEQEVYYYARHQKQAQPGRAFKAREQAEG